VASHEKARLAPRAAAARSRSRQAASGHRQDVSQQSLRSIVERLVSFGTRHTLSSQTDPEARHRRFAAVDGGGIPPLLQGLRQIA
jgi:hypothetical protein